MQEYTRTVQTVTAWQTPWPMTITVNGKAIVGNAGDWLVIPPNNADPYFMGDIQFTQQFTAAPVV